MPHNIDGLGVWLVVGAWVWEKRAKGGIKTANKVHIYDILILQVRLETGQIEVTVYSDLPKFRPLITVTRVSLRYLWKA